MAGFLLTSGNLGSLRSFNGQENMAFEKSKRNANHKFRRLPGGVSALSKNDDFGSHGHISVFIDGFIADLGPLSARFTRIPKKRRNGSDYIAQFIAEMGLDHFLAHANGSYTVVVHNAKRGSFHAIRDPMGSTPLYFSASKGHIFNPILFIAL